MLDVSTNANLLSGAAQLLAQGDSFDRAVADLLAGTASAYRKMVHDTTNPAQDLFEPPGRFYGDEADATQHADRMFSHEISIARRALERLELQH